MKEARILFLATTACLVHCAPLPKPLPTGGKPVPGAAAESNAREKPETVSNQAIQPPKTTWHRPNQLGADSYDAIVRSNGVLCRAIVTEVLLHPDNKSLAKIRFSQIESDEENSSEDSDQSQSRSTKIPRTSEADLILPHNNRPVPLIKGQEVHLGFAPDGRIIYIHYGFIIDAWRMTDGAVEVIGRPYFTQPQRNTSRIHIAPHQIATESDKQDVVVTLTESTGTQLQNWEGGDNSESENLVTASASEEFPAANLSPQTQHAGASSWNALLAKQPDRPLARALLQSNNANDSTKQNLKEELSQEKLSTIRNP